MSDDIQDLQIKLAKAQADADMWKTSFERVVTSIMSNMEERYRLLNHCFAYRAAMKDFLTQESGYSEEDANDLIRLSMSEFYLVERIKHRKILGE